MTPSDIQKEWDSFIEYPEGSGKLYVTTTSALLFARCIADMAADKEREACEGACGELANNTENSEQYRMAANWCRERIRARGNT